MTSIDEKLADSIRYIKGHTRQAPGTGVVLGSGLSGLERKLTQRVGLENRDIPHYPVPHIEGHPGKLVFGQISSTKGRLGSPVVLFVGRTHFYESGDINRVIYPIRVAQKLGVKNLILTNAAGAVNPAFSPGDLMLITGQINLTFQTLRLNRKGLLPKSAYDSSLTELARLAAERNHIPLKEGVYCGVTGPSYETAAEIEMIRRIGADAVGMSTVHEAAAACRLGMRLLGISLITNLATGLAGEPATHDEVIRVARQAKKRFETLLMNILTFIDDHSARPK